MIQLFSMDEIIYKREPNLVPNHVGDQLIEAKLDRHGDEITLGPAPPLKTYSQRLKLCSPEHGSNYSLLTVFWQPFPTMRYPAVLWCALVYGVQICWLSLVSTSQAEFFESPPYNFSADAVGLINFAALIGGLFGMRFTGSTDHF